MGVQAGYSPLGMQGNQQMAGYSPLQALQTMLAAKGQQGGPGNSPMAKLANALIAARANPANRKTVDATPQQWMQNSTNPQTLNPVNPLMNHPALMNRFQAPPAMQVNLPGTQPNG